ncbi:MAG: terminase family protein, partial [Sphaerobacter sp.]|nr:terminase family protein [Sphaerobacter sp.]
MPRQLPPVERRRLLRLIQAEQERRRTPPDLHPKQRVAFESTATEILYGGAAGGGKSHLMRLAAITWCQWVPGLQVYLFRREFPDLFKNHMEGPGSFPALLGPLLAAGEARIVWGKNQIRFRNGSVIHLCHCQYPKDVYGYQGAEIHVLMIDELTQWTREMYTFLRSRVRLGGLRVPPWLRHLFPRILCGANPGGRGHNWVKADFIDIAAPLAITPMPKSEGGMLRQYIPARLEDNPSLLANDPDYESRL